MANLNQIWKDELYVYVATSSGLDVIELANRSKAAYVEYDVGFTAVWGSSDLIYLGTSSAGIKYLVKEDISVNYTVPVDLTGILNDYAYFYNVSTNSIKYLHGYDTTLLVVTSSGIDLLNNGTSRPFKSTFNNKNVTKGFMVNSNVFYYVIQDSAADGIFRMNSVYCDWSVPDVSYLTGSSFIPEETIINDIFITEGTSINTVDNTLFVATNAGALVFDEGSSEFDIYSIE